MHWATSQRSLDLAVPIGPGIHLYEPPLAQSEATATSPGPTLIILSIWLGGETPRRVSKYVAGHLCGIIFDCCPGYESFGRVYNAAAASLPDAWLAQAVGKAFLVPAISIITLLQYLGAMNSIPDLRRELSDPDMVGTTTKRLYLYSSHDQMMQWQNVETHLEAAKLVSGHPVTGVRFEESAHCAIIRNHADTYWKAICDFWQTNTRKPRSRL